MHSVPGRNCPLCGSTRGVALARLTYALFDDLDISGDKTLKQCAACGLAYDDVAFSPAQLGDYYRHNEHYAATADGGGGGVSPDNEARYDRILEALALDGSGCILDYGCGQGGFLARCAARGLRAAGVEPCMRSRMAGQAAGRDIHASLEAFVTAHSKEPVQAVVVSHVLEHLLDPAALLYALAYVAREVRIYLEVPEAAYLGPDPVRWDQLYFEHLSHFQGGSLAALASRCGIAVEGEGVAGFSPAQADIPCRSVVGRYQGPGQAPTVAADVARPELSPLPAVPGANLPVDRPLALWGVSQYAMLLIGSNPSLRPRWLFDISPAKLGRCIGGVAIGHPAGVAALPSEALLVVPSSAHAPNILHAMREYGYRGEAVVL